MKAKSPEKQLAGFIDKYTLEIGGFAREVLEKMRLRLPGAIELVYDNYNALVIGFGPTERPSEAIFSVVLNPRWVSLCFLQGASLPDPHRLLRGSGNVVRHVRLEVPEDLDKPAIEELIVRALARARTPLKMAGEGRLIIRSISEKQRPRRPAK